MKTDSENLIFGHTDSSGDIDNPEHIVVNMNINYDNKWGRQNHILVVDDLDNKQILYECGSVGYSKEEKDTKYPNLDYFSDLGP